MCLTGWPSGRVPTFEEKEMARHWSSYTNPALSDKQVRALDRMGQAHGIGDGLDVLARANDLSRSKAGKMAADRFQVAAMVDAAFKQFSRKDG
jgi:hypothetical protein